ncbi:MAG: DNA integrity scanning protein DisA nucleotide-binding domain protein [Myxococcales bacterium]|nr:DNA integrity scanning protein DisA nucleotide-binding domain protein [Myxococcales bacterium]
MTDDAEKKLDEVRSLLQRQNFSIPNFFTLPTPLLEEFSRAYNYELHERRCSRYGAILAGSGELDGASGVSFVEATDDVASKLANGVDSFVLREELQVVGSTQETRLRDSRKIRNKGNRRRLAIVDPPLVDLDQCVEFCYKHRVALIRREESGTIWFVLDGEISRLEHQTLTRFDNPMVDAEFAKLFSDFPGWEDTFADALRFATCDVVPYNAGTTLVLCPTEELARDEVKKQSNQSSIGLRIGSRADRRVLANYLAQMDGATILDNELNVVAVGVQLVPSDEAVRNVVADPRHGTRHSSAARYSYDNPALIVVVVSQDGPISVFRSGKAFNPTDRFVSDLFDAVFQVYESVWERVGIVCRSVFGDRVGSKIVPFIRRSRLGEQ